MTRLAPVVAVVMPVRNEAENLESSVSAVLSQKFAGQLEVCLAVGPSLDETAEIARRLTVEDGRVHVVENPTGLTPSGLNAAIRATSAPVVVRVDGHSELCDGYIARALETLERTGAVNVGGIQEPRGQTPFEVAVGRAMSSHFGVGNSRFHFEGAEGAVDTVYLGVFRRVEIEAVGLFDESLVRNQDYELNWRLRSAGGIVWFDPALRVAYRPRGTLRALARQFFEFGQWKRRVVGLHPRSIRWRQVVPPVVTLAVLLGTLLSVVRPAFLVLPLTYLGAVTVASMISGRSLSEVLRLLGVFPTMHLAWGVGFLVAARTRRQ